jgi:hypothetical protein
VLTFCVFILVVPLRWLVHLSVSSFAARATEYQRRQATRGGDKSFTRHEEKFWRSAFHPLGNDQAVLRLSPKRKGWLSDGTQTARRE